MDFMMDKLVWLLNKFGSGLNVPHIPYEKFSGFMRTMEPYLAQANTVFPVDDLLVMVAIVVGIRAILWVIWGIVFVRNMLPF